MDTETVVQSQHDHSYRAMSAGCANDPVAMLPREEGDMGDRARKYYGSGKDRGTRIHFLYCVLISCTVL